LSDFKEGCLSFPGLYLKIRRSSKIRVKFNAIGGEEIEQEFDGLTATVIQHEVDHLNGICYTDLINDVVLQREKRKMKVNIKKMKRAKLENT
jgi:peptide deformylase